MPQQVRIPSISSITECTTSIESSLALEETQPARYHVLCFVIHCLVEQNKEILVVYFLYLFIASASTPQIGMNLVSKAVLREDIVYRHVPWKIALKGSSTLMQYFHSPWNNQTTIFQQKSRRDTTLPRWRHLKCEYMRYWATQRARKCALVTSQLKPTLPEDLGSASPLFSV